MQKKIKQAPVVGFVRYSQKIDFGSKNKDMFEKGYFEYRFEIFTKVTLKSFQQQTDQNFVLLLLHSQNMPHELKKRFLELEEANSFMYNVFVDDTSQSFDEALEQSINYSSFDNGAVITFRIDNDDAVQNDYIQNLRAFANEGFIGYAISIPTIAIVKRVSENEYMIEERYYPSNSIGLAYVTGSVPYKTIMDEKQHHLINDTNTIVVIAKNAAAGLQTINGENAINAINNANAKTLKDVDFRQYLNDKKLGTLELTCLRIFDEQHSHAKSLLRKTFLMLIPPIIPLGAKKVKDAFIKR